MTSYDISGGDFSDAVLGSPTTNTVQNIFTQGDDSENEQYQEAQAPQIASDTSTSFEIMGGDFSRATLGNSVKKTVHKNYFQGPFSQQITSIQTDVLKEKPPLHPRSYSADGPFPDAAFFPRNTGQTHLSSNIIMYGDAPIDSRSQLYPGKLHSSITGGRDILIKFIPYSLIEENKARISYSVPEHDNLVERVWTDVYQQGGFHSIYLAIENCHRFNLRQYVEGLLKDGTEFDPNTFGSFGFQVTNGLNFLHENNIFHGNLKPSTILLSCDQNTIKLSDFGLAKFDDKFFNAQEAVGRPDGWHAPEFLKGSKKIAKANDIFPLGLTLYYLWSYGKHPYGQDSTSWNHYIKRDENRRLDGTLVPNTKYAVDLLEQMLEYDPQRRPTTTEILKNPVLEMHGNVGEPISNSQLTEVISDCLSEIQMDQAKAFVKSKRPLKGTVAAQKSMNLSRSQLTSVLDKVLSDGHLELRLKKSDGICCFDTNAKALKVYNPAEKTWTQMQGMKDNMVSRNFTAVVLDSFIYVLMCNGKVYRLNFSDVKSTWCKVSKMKENHGKWPPACTLGGHIYAVGHYGHSKPILKNAMESYDPSSDKWIHVTDVRKRRQDHVVVGATGCIYCIGGRDRTNEALASVERYDLSLKKWFKISPMHTARISPSAVSADFKIYVIGGFGKNIPTEFYEPMSNTWTTLAPMQCQRSYFRACFAGGNVFAVGGNNPEDIEMLDDENKWKVVETMSGMTINTMATICVKI